MTRLWGRIAAAVLIVLSLLAALVVSGPGAAVAATSAPTADSQSVTVPYNTARPITLSSPDANVTYTVVTSPAHGALSGTAPNLTYQPTTGYSGPDSFDFTASNSNGTSAPATVSITVLPPPPTITSVTPTSGSTSGGTSVVIGGTNLAGAMSVTFGGAAASSYTIRDSTQITAITPSHAPGVVNVAVMTSGGTGTLAGGFTYAAPTVTVAPASLPNGTVGVAYSQSFSGSGGRAPYTYAVTSGAVPAGMTVSSTGFVAGTPTAGGAFSFTITATDADNNTGSRSYTLSIAAPTITVAPATLPAATASTFYSQSITASGGTAPYSYAITAGALPAGITLSSGGVLSGNTTTTGSFTFTVTASDSSTGTGPYTGSRSYTLTVNRAAPTVTAVSPTSGPTGGGTSVTITGTGFTAATAVTFGATSASYTVNSATQITAVSPAGTGTVDVRVTTAGGTSATSVADQFTYAAAPTVTAVSPTSGPTAGGTSVTITGTNFAGASSVTFGSTAASYTVNSATQITAVSPAGTGTVDVSVTTAGGTSATSAADRFAYAPIPTVTAISPTSGVPAGGTSVTITGTGFTPSAAVSFGSTLATYTYVSATTLTATSPAGTGTVDVTVTTAGGTSATSAADRFAYVTPEPPVVVPSVTKVSPSRAPVAGGTTVVITGGGLSGVTSVRFGGVDAQRFTVRDGSTVEAVTPAHAAGTVDLVLRTADGASSTPASFTFVAAPTISGITPAQGSTAGGTHVTLSGTGFLDTTAVVVGSSAATFTVASDTTIDAVVPAHDAGAVAVSVTTPYGTGSKDAAFTYVGDSTTAPQVSALDRSSGPQQGGSRVPIEGTGLASTTGVVFGKRPATRFVVVSDTLVVAVAPRGHGAVTVRVQTPAGTATAPGHFVYRPRPAVTGLSRHHAPRRGGVRLVVHGHGFTDATSVLVGGARVSNPTLLSGSRLALVLPPHRAGRVGVRVVGPGGTSKRSSDAVVIYGGSSHHRG